MLGRLRLGIEIERIQPWHPGQNGRHEQTHLTWRSVCTTKPKDWKKYRLHLRRLLSERRIPVQRCVGILAVESACLSSEV